MRGECQRSNGGALAKQDTLLDQGVEIWSSNSGVAISRKMGDSQRVQRNYKNIRLLQQLFRASAVRSCPAGSQKVEGYCDRDSRDGQCEQNPSVLPTYGHNRTYR